MKQLLVMRHAKSSRDHPGLQDVERPLNKRGEQDGPRMGTLLKTKKLIPQLILSSTAVRARRTAEIMAYACGYNGKIRGLDAFYEAGPADYIQELRRVDDRIHSVMIIGHNPGLESLLEQLCGDEQRLPTAAIACLGLPIDRWEDLSLKTPTQLQHLWRPKEIWKD